MSACSFAAAGGAVFAAARAQGVLSSQDFGRTWKSANSGLSGMNTLCLTSVGKNVFAGCAGGHVSFTSNYGASWTPIDSGLPAADVLSLAVKGTTLFAGCAGKGVWRLELTGSTPAISECAPLSAEPQARLLMRNGASSRLQVSYNCAGKDRLSILLYDMRGAKKATLFAGTTGPGNHVMTFDMNVAPPGTCIARIKIGNETFSRRIVVTR
jgi:hypothetical protein